MRTRSARGSSWPLWLTVLYVAVLAAISLLNYIGADETWLGAFNLYLPQVIWLIPGLILSLLMFKMRRRWTWLPLLCILWAGGPIMGCNVAAPKKAAPGALKVRVMTWNIKYGYYNLLPLFAEIDRCRPDVVFFQDAGGFMDGPLPPYFRNWQLRASGQYVIASRYRLSEAEEYELPYYPGHRRESLLRCSLYLGAAKVALYNVHLKTPRSGLNQFRTARRRPWYLPEAIDNFVHNVNTRLLQAAKLSYYLGLENQPVILAGDLNAPEASRVCGILRAAGLHDAFAEGGNGFGYTYGHFLFKYRLPWLRISWMRIDHIMTSRGFATERCWAGTGEASDHRPVIADLVL